MKHDLKITVLLVLFFVLAQIVGLALINHKLISEKAGVKVVGYEETVLGELPRMSGEAVLLYVVVGVAIGTVIVLLIIRLRKVSLWRAWFFIAVFLAISLALGVILKYHVALLLALILALLKLFKPNVFIHNLTEVLMYAGISFFIVGLFKDKVLWIALLLVLVSVYDFIAVFKSKHMVRMARFQTKSGVFAGLFIPYTTGKDAPREQGVSAMPMRLIRGVQSPKRIKTRRVVQRKNAILGGGDVAFPLIFTGVVMHWLANKFVRAGVATEVARSMAFYQSLIITLTTTIALTFLFVFAKKDKFYPAMPFITMGCFAGFVIITLL